MGEIIMSDSTGADGTQTPDGQTQTNTDGVGKKQDKVSYETFDKAMSSLNREKQARKELEEKLQKIQEEKMLAEGKKDEFIESLKSKYSALEEAVKKEKAQRALDNFKYKLSEVAAKKGFKNPSLATKLFQISDFELDQNNDVRIDQIESKFEELRQKESYLFAQSQTKVPDGNPITKVDAGTITKDDLGKLSKKELFELAKNFK